MIKTLGLDMRGRRIVLALMAFLIVSAVGFTLYGLSFYPAIPLVPTMTFFVVLMVVITRVRMAGAWNTR